MRDKNSVMAELYNHAMHCIPKYSEERPDYCSEVFWFSRCAIIDVMSRMSQHRDLVDDVTEIDAGMTTKADHFYSTFLIRHLIDKHMSEYLTNVLDPSLSELARSVISYGTLDDAYARLGDVANMSYAGEYEDRAAKKKTMGMRARGYQRLRNGVVALRELIEEHQKSHYAVVGAMAGLLIAGWEGSPGEDAIHYPSSQIIPLYSMMRSKGAVHEG